jgi:hypothetical protein
MIQVIDSNRRIRANHGQSQADSTGTGLLAAGRLPARMLTNTMLSIPSTTSRMVSVTSAVQFSGEVISSSFYNTSCCREPAEIRSMAADDQSPYGTDPHAPCRDSRWGFVLLCFAPIFGWLIAAVRHRDDPRAFP